MARSGGGEVQARSGSARQATGTLVAWWRGLHLRPVKRGTAGRMLASGRVAHTHDTATVADSALGVARALTGWEAWAPTCPKSASGSRSADTQLPLAVFHRRTLLSWEPVASSCPHGEKARATTQELWPSSTDVHCPVAASHSRAVLSRPQLARRAPAPPGRGEDNGKGTLRQASTYVCAQLARGQHPSPGHRPGRHPVALLLPRHQQYSAWRNKQVVLWRQAVQLCYTCSKQRAHLLGCTPRPPQDPYALSSRPGTARWLCRRRAGSCRQQWPAACHQGCS